MKKSSLYSLVSYLNGETVTNIDEIKAELEAEITKNEEKAQANRELYASAHDAAVSHLTDTPIPLFAWYSACESDLPEGFSKSKLQYAAREYWQKEVKITEGRTNKYSRA